MVMLGIIHTCTALRYKPGFYSDAVECLTATQEILVSILCREKRCLAFFHLLHTCSFTGDGGFQLTRGPGFISAP